MKQMLLFMTPFYGYSNEIIKQLENEGWDVSFYSDEIEWTFFKRVLMKINKKSVEKQFDKYFEKCISEQKGKKFDEILIIFGLMFFTKRHFERLKEEFPGAKLVYYVWDSECKFPVIKQLLSASDIAYTFDNVDAKNNNANFLPLYYVKKQKATDNYKYDASTVLTFFADKYESLKLITSVLKDRKLYLYLRFSTFTNFIKLLICSPYVFKGIGRKHFHFQALNKQQLQDVFDDSFAIIDCPLTHQHGLTMRTFEALSRSKKLITTNKNIKNYPFYTEDNIFVSEDENIKIPDNFFTTPFNEDFQLDEKYSLENFVKTLTDI